MEDSVFVRKTLRGLPSKGKLLLCVSGGADSMALLHACVEGGRECVVAHCDFHLRGDESERDRRFVEWVCRRLHVECVTLHFDVDSYMRIHSVSMEMACRDLRYAAFRRLREEKGCVRIVVAHNSGDNDETMLLNLFRGTGLRGLCGMEADNGEIARPLLGMSRSDIVSFLNSKGRAYVTDSSNLTSDFRRNFIRRELLPAIEERWPGVRKALERTRRNMIGYSTFCDDAVRRVLRDKGSALFLPAEVFEEYPSKSVLLHSFLKDYGVTPSQIDEMAAGLRPGCRWRLRSVDVFMDSRGLHVCQALSESNAVSIKYKTEKLPLTQALMAEIIKNKDNYILYYSGEEDVHFRVPAQGDRMAPIGMKGTKLVSDLLHEAGVPLPMRGRVPLLADNRGRVIWIPGIRRSRHMLADISIHKYVCKLTVAEEDNEK